MSDGELVHVAGLVVHVNGRMRQRCGWCGTLMLDYNLPAMAVPVGQDPTPATWPLGALVNVHGNASFLVELGDDQPLPLESCARLDPEVTT